MDEKEIKVSESIKILGEVSISRRQQFTEKYSSESKSIGDFDFDEFSSTSYCSESYDDEVFVEPDDFERTMKEIRVIHDPRKRRTSDVIDSMGDTPPKEKAHFFPNDFFDVEGPSFKFGSPPITPGSDMGYYSNCGPSTPPSLLDFKPAWSRVSSFSDGPSIEDKKQDNPVVDQTDGGDESDAKPNRPPSYTHPNTHEAKMPVARDSPEYNMNHPRRGCAHIFNHDTFSNLMPPRKGSDVDVKELATVYELLGFDVEVHQNLDYAGLQTVIQRIVKEDYTDCDCISIAVLTHGQESNLLYTSDCLYSVESLWQSFTPDKCPTLAGKPKLFFIQACRGQKLDGGTTLGRYTTETDSASDSYKIPKMADFLIAYSTADGYYSWRNPENGTWFVQSLCHVLREHHQTTDLLRMLTIVSRKVAVEHESYSDIRLDLNAQKQVPSISSTLIRDVFLRSK